MEATLTLSETRKQETIVIHLAAVRKQTKPNWTNLRRYLLDTWAPGHLAQDYYGNPVDPMAADVRGLSIGGAVQRLFTQNRGTAMMAAITSACAVIHNSCVMTWEDAPGRTWADVIHLLKVAEWLTAKGFSKAAGEHAMRYENGNPQLTRTTEAALAQIRQYSQTLRAEA